MKHLVNIKHKLHNGKRANNTVRKMAVNSRYLTRRKCMTFWGEYTSTPRIQRTSVPGYDQLRVPGPVLPPGAGCWASTRNGIKPGISAHRLTRAGRTGQTRCDLRIAKSHNRYTNNLLPDALHRQILSIATF